MGLALVPPAAPSRLDLLRGVAGRSNDQARWGLENQAEAQDEFGGGWNREAGLEERWRSGVAPSPLLLPLLPLHQGTGAGAGGLHLGEQPEQKAAAATKKAQGSRQGERNRGLSTS